MKTSRHAMTSEDASIKKKGGHKREIVRKNQLGENAKVIPGNGKVDILRADGKTESVKGGKKTQWALYTINRIISDDYFTTEEIQTLTKWINHIPDDKNEWEKNRKYYSINLNAVSLVEVFKNNPMKLVDYFCGVNKVDYLTTEDYRDGVWTQTSMIDFSNKIKNNIKEVYYTDGGKLVISGGEKNTILFELELRKGKSSHKRVLFHSHLDRIIDCIK